jgi:hypothetical protein
MLRSNTTSQIIGHCGRNLRSEVQIFPSGGQIGVVEDVGRGQSQAKYFVGNKTMNCCPREVYNKGVRYREKLLTYIGNAYD